MQQNNVYNQNSFFNFIFLKAWNDHWTTIGENACPLSLNQVLLDSSTIMI